MSKFKAVLLSVGVFLLAFAWKLFIGTLIVITIFFIARKLVDTQYYKKISSKWD